MIKSVKKRTIAVSAIFQIFLILSMSFTIAFFLSDNFVNAVDFGALASIPSGTSGIGQLQSASSGINLAGSAAGSGAATTAPSTMLSSSGSSSLSSGGGLSGATGGGKEIAKDVGNKGSGDLSTSISKIYNGQGFGLGGEGATTTSSVAGSLVAGAAWALTAYMAVKFIGGMLGLEEGTQKALEKAVTSGAFVTGTLQAMTTNNINLFGAKSGFFNTVQTSPYMTGLVIAVVIFVLTYKDTSKQLVQFQCLPYEPPIGGQKCEECNKDIFRPCTEYRCKSLGQACQLLNPETSSAQCAWVGRNDVNSPTITLDTNVLKPKGLKYNPDNALRPGSLGTKIVNSAGNCLPAFTPLEFGFNTNEPSQCKVDFNHTVKLEDMSYFVGDSNFYIYNHTQKMRLPGPTNETEAGFPLLRNDGYYSLYVRCRDANGNENVDEFSFAFCVDKTDDTTPPVIEDFSLPSGSFVTFNNDVVPIETYVNEPSECKWSTQDKSYTDMENNMNCNTNPSSVNANLQYTCKGNLTGIKDMEDNKFYFRCKDQPTKVDSERNVNAESKELILKGSQQLFINSIMPNETITGSTDAVKVDLTVETFAGSESGKAECFFSNTATIDSFVPMFETNSFAHKQNLILPKGNYTYYIRCIDSGGNAAQNSTNFEVFTDRDPPMVTRLYKQQDAIKVVTDEDAQCVFSFNSCSYAVDDAAKSAENTMIYSDTDIEYNLYAPWKAGVTYYIKCKDKYGNEPAPNQCSVIASPIQLTK